MKRKTIYIIFLLVYIFAFFCLAVLYRTPFVYAKTPVMLSPFHSYIQLNVDGFNDIALNIGGFIPVGILVGMLTDKNRVVKALLSGLVFSLIVECSQLLLKRGTFDMDDIFNNSLGALIGGLIVVLIMRIRKTLAQKGVDKEILN